MPEDFGVVMAEPGTWSESSCRGSQMVKEEMLRPVGDF